MRIPALNLSSPIFNRSLLVFALLLLVVVFSGCAETGGEQTPSKVMPEHTSTPESMPEVTVESADQTATSTPRGLSSPSRAGSPTATLTPTPTQNKVSNPWGRLNVTVSISNNITGNQRNATIEAVQFWESNTRRYGSYPINITYTDDQSGDVLIDSRQNGIDCGYTVIADAIGCAPILKGNYSINDTVKIRILAGMHPTRTRATVKHELGHVLGLTHNDSPQGLMGHGNLTERQRQVAQSVDEEELARDIEREINRLRDRKGYEQLDYRGVLEDQAQERLESVVESEDRSATTSRWDNGCDIQIDTRFIDGGTGDVYSVRMFTPIVDGYFVNVTTTRNATYLASHEKIVKHVASVFVDEDLNPYLGAYDQQGAAVEISNSGEIVVTRAVC